MVSFSTYRGAWYGHRNLHGTSRSTDPGKGKAKINSTQPNAAAAAAAAANAAIKPDGQSTQGQAKARDPPTKSAATVSTIKSNDAAAVSAALAKSYGGST